MATLKEQIEAARKEGYSDQEITTFLGTSHPELSGKIKEATSAGYEPGEILGHLSSAPVKGPGMVERFAEGTALPGIARGLVKGLDKGTLSEKADQAVMNAWDTLKHITIGATEGHLAKAKEAAKAGDYKGAVESTLRGVNSLMPSGQSVDVGEKVMGDLKSGNFAGALGTIAMVAIGARGLIKGGKVVASGEKAAAGEASTTLRQAVTEEALQGAKNVMSKELQKVPGMSVPVEGYKFAQRVKARLNPEPPKPTPGTPAPRGKVPAPEEPLIVQPSVVGAGRPSEAPAQFQSPAAADRATFDPARIGYPNANPEAGGTSVAQPLAPKGPTSTQWMPDRIGSDPVQQMHPDANPNAGGSGFAPPMPELQPKGPQGPKTVFEMGTTNRTPVQELYPQANQNAGGSPGGGPPGSSLAPPMPERGKIVFEDAPKSPVASLYPNANFDAGGGSGAVPPTPKVPPTPAELKSAGFGLKEEIPPEVTIEHPNETVNRARKTSAVSKLLYNEGKGLPREKIELLQSKDPALKAQQDAVWSEIEKVSGKVHSPKSRGQILKKTLDLHDEVPEATPETPLPEQP